MQSRMQSLRTRQPDQRRALQKPKPQAAPKAKDANSRKSRVDDKIKKRMSMRYADISAPTDTSAVPAVPSIPIGAAGSRAKLQDEIVLPRDQAGGREREDMKVVDVKLLDQEPFNAESFLKEKLASSTEGELKSLQSTLRGYRDDTVSDLQRNVFKNYAEFVAVSKEIGTLENDLLELKESLAEWRSMPSLLHIDEHASVADRRRTQRSSVADLRILYANQLQTLHQQVEGSSKFVPTISGRHIVAEIDGISSLNSATYKVEHQCRFVILNDTILVARKRKRRNGGEGGKMVAERCWPLAEIQVLDTKDSHSMSNVFKIKYQKESYVYRTDLLSDKKNLLSQFRQVAEELQEKKRKEREGEHERRMSVWDKGGSSLQSLSMGEKGLVVPEWLSAYGPGAASTSGGGAKEKAEKDARWVAEWSDELVVAIALREWEDAVQLVEKGESKLGVTPSLSTKLTPLTAQLTSALLDALTKASRKSAVVALIAHLLRLHAGPQARACFLRSRTALMRKRSRMIRFEGHIPSYVTDLAMVVFTGIKHTADWFLASFKENEVSSAFVKWAKEQIETYAEMFRKQVFTSDVSQQTIDECISKTHEQSRKLLLEYGLDFRYLLDELLVRNPIQRRAAAPSVSIPSTTAPRSKPTAPSIITTDLSTPSSRGPVPRTPSSARGSGIGPRPSGMVDGTFTLPSPDGALPVPPLPPPSSSAAALSVSSSSAPSASSRSRSRSGSTATDRAYTPPPPSSRSRVDSGRSGRRPAPVTVPAPSPFPGQAF